MFYNFDLSFIKNMLHISCLRMNDYIEICIISLVVFYLIRKIKDTRAWILLKGCIMVLCLYEFAYIMSFDVIACIMKSLVTFIIIALVIMFQPELRKFLETLGRKNFTLGNFVNSMKHKNAMQTYYSDGSIDELIKSANIMSKAKTGALILIERQSDLSMYESSGIPMHADITSQLIINAFEKNTPLHDGAMIIRNDRIIAATCYLPLSDNRDIDKNLGTRHRAAIGASEETDALILVVSEETGAVSIVENGNIMHDVSIEKLREMLSDCQCRNGILQEMPKDNFGKSIKTLLLSAVFSLTAWMFLSTLTDPTVTVKFTNIPVSIINDSKIADDGYVYEVLKGNTVNIDVSGKKSVVSGLSQADFKAYADAGEMSVTNSMNIFVQTAKYSPGISIDTHNAMTTITVEEAVSIDCIVTAESTGNAAEGYYVAELIPSAKTITITGAKSKLKTIDKAVASVDISGKSCDFESTSALSVYDKNGNVFDSANCMLSIDEVSISGMVCRTKSVPVKVSAHDSSHDNYSIEISTVKLEKPNLLISAADSILDETDGIYIDIDISSVQGNSALITINPANYMPDGVYYAGDDAEFDISMNIKRYAEDTITIYSDNIKTINGECRIDEISFDINVRCDADKDMDIMEELNPYINLDDAEQNECRVLIRTDSKDIEIMNDAWATIHKLD